jgi:hypothetical protein
MTPESGLNMMLHVRVQLQTPSQNKKPYFLAYKMHQPIRHTLILAMRREKLLRDYADENSCPIYGPETPTTNPYTPLLLSMSWTS